MIKIAPSLLAADYLKLGEEILRVKDAGADYLHFDVMDGSFVPNISFGPELLRQAAACGLPVDAHLMIVNPEKYIDAFAKAGAEIITVHAEAATHLHRCLQQIRAAGCLAGVALNPATSPDCLRYVMGDFDLALVMTVNPGYGGQRLIPACIRKVGEVRSMLWEAGCEARTVSTALSRSTPCLAQSSRLGRPLILMPRSSSISLKMLRSDGGAGTPSGTENDRPIACP